MIYWAIFLLISVSGSNPYITNHYKTINKPPEVELDPSLDNIIGKKVIKHLHCMEKYSGDLDLKQRNLEIDKNNGDNEN